MNAIDDGKIHYKKTHKQILVWWVDHTGKTLGQRFYPRSSNGLDRAQRQIISLIRQGYSLEGEALLY